MQRVLSDRDMAEWENTVFVNSKWCNLGHVTMEVTICMPDVELPAVGLRPYYLPREFSVAIVIVVHILPLAVAVRACDVIHHSTADMASQCTPHNK